VVALGAARDRQPAGEVAPGWAAAVGEVIWVVEGGWGGATAANLGTAAGSPQGADEKCGT
jgi:hypothetical protein